MVRIFCLTSITKQLLFIDKSINTALAGPSSEANDDYPGDNTKAALEKLRNDCEIFAFYELTEISIGHHFNGIEKVFLLLIFRKDSGLIVFKMIPGSIKFQEISKDVCQFTVPTSSLFSNIDDFDLVIRIRCIKNTSVRGISEVEIKYYEKVVNDIKVLCKNNQKMQEFAFDKINFELPKQSSQKVLKQKIIDIRTLVELLCDERTGSIENIPENARYNQRATCYKLTENAKTRNTSISRNRSPSLTVDDDLLLTSFYDDDTWVSTTASPTSSGGSRKRGRPRAYETREERKRAHNQSSKKYMEKLEERYKYLQKEVHLLEMENQDLFEKYKELCARGAVMEERLTLQNMLHERDNFESSINDRENTVKASLPKIDDHFSRTAKQRLLVQRIRMKRKTEREMVEMKHRFFLQQNEKIKKKIESLRNLINWNNSLNDQRSSNLMEHGVEFFKTETPFVENEATSEPIQMHLPYPSYTSPSADQCDDFAMVSYNYQLPNNTIPANSNDACSLYSLLPKYSAYISPPSSNFANENALKLQHANVNEVCECFFEKLPPSLIFLDSSNNNISFFSKSISRLKSLKTLNLSKNFDLSFIPWGSLPSSIEKLNLSDTGIDKISAVNILQKIKILELSKAKLSSLPESFENLFSLRYLNLSTNKFDRSSDLDELLWNRLPPNLSILKLCNNNLGELPCILKSRKFKYLSVNNCNLSKICSRFLNHSRQSNMILEIAGNWKLETLPIIPTKIIPPTLTKADTPENFYFNGLNVFTDNESFISMSRFPTTSDNKPIYEFNGCNKVENSCCKCCAICGNPREEVIKQLMVMDFNLCLSTSFDETKIDLFEHGKDMDVGDILQKLIDKMKNEMHLVYAPSNWKTEVVTGLCFKCLTNLKAKIEEAAALNAFNDDIKTKWKTSWPEASSLKQLFSLPSSIIYYITKNPSTPEVYLKLTQTCKYFFEKHPLLVAARIYDFGRHLCSNDRNECINNRQYKCCVKVAKIRSKIWLTSDLCFSFITNLDVAPLFISKLYRCENAQLSITCSKIAMKDFELFASKFKKFGLFYAKIVDIDGSDVMVEKILESIPTLKEFHYKNYDNTPAISISTMKNMLKLNNLSNLRIFEMFHISEVINVNDLCEFFKRQQDTKIQLSFYSDISDGYKNQLDGLIDGIIASNIPDRLIYYSGQDQDKLQIMTSRYNR